MPCNDGESDFEGLGRIITIDLARWLAMI